MKGVRDNEGQYSGTLAKIMGHGGFKVKVMVSSGETDQEAKDMIGDKVLGYSWDATTDEMAVTFPINLANKIRKTKQKPDVTTESLESLPDA